ncbi:acetylxylan esterase [Paenibacillus koleovorans]|uniref:acetylxylan esterase n=1 Tax=Paenibacillus koleovorans TaxID=121608 RepID=UPI001FE606FA|nr:acetylxylan esterase [Paenibacillus koleovorans]
MLADRLNKLKQYQPAPTAADDFDTFWQANLRQSAARPLRARAERVDHPCEIAMVYDVAYVGLKDPVCPPETIYAAFNAIQAEKEMAVYPDFGHEDTHQATVDMNLRFVKQFL